MLRQWHPRKGKINMLNPAWYTSRIALGPRQAVLYVTSHWKETGPQSLTGLFCLILFLVMLWKFCFYLFLIQDLGLH